MEDEQKQNEEDLVKELASTLHQESTGDFSTTMQAVFLCRNLTGTDGVLHTRRGCHGIFASNTDTVEEQSPGVADNPTILGGRPRTRPT